MYADALPTHWREVAETVARYGADAVAATLRRCADELETALRSAAEPLLTLQQAAAVSGYSIDHLGRLVREGVVPNHGRKGSPRVRASELPRRPIASRAQDTYDANADARALRSRRSSS